MAKTKTVAEVAGLLGVSKVAIQSRIKRGTLRGKKIDGRWRIPQSEVERLMTGVDNVADNAIEHGTNVGSNVTENVGDNVTDNVDSHVFAPTESDPLHAELSVVRSEHDSLSGEVQVLHVKLEAAERQHETTYRALERSESEVEHLRGLTDQQANTMQNLTEEIKGLTIALHHEQAQRLQLAADVDDKAEDDEPKKPGFLRRVFTGKPKPKRPRKGKFARVGPS